VRIAQVMRLPYASNGRRMRLAARQTKTMVRVFKAQIP